MTADDAVLFSTLAVQGPLQRDVLPLLCNNLRVREVYDPTSVLLRRLEAGERADVIVALTPDVEELARRQVTGPPVALARTGVGVGFASNTARPDVSSVDQLVQALTTARSVAYSRSGASGRYFAGLLDRLGIAGQVNARATIVEKGYTGQAVVDGRADLAIQQISELRFVEGIEVAGPLPADVQHHSEFSAACSAELGRPGSALVQALTSDQARSAYRRWGLDY